MLGEWSTASPHLSPRYRFLPALPCYRASLSSGVFSTGPGQVRAVIESACETLISTCVGTTGIAVSKNLR